MTSREDCSGRAIWVLWGHGLCPSRKPLSSASQGTGKCQCELPLWLMECDWETWLSAMCGRSGQLILRTYIGMETVYPRMGYWKPWGRRRCNSTKTSPRVNSLVCSFSTKSRRHKFSFSHFFFQIKDNRLFKSVSCYFYSISNELSPIVHTHTHSTTISATTWQ